MSPSTTQFAIDRDAGVASKRLRVMAFEIETLGHHPSYIRNFAEQWARKSLPAEIDFVVTPLFFERHREVVDAVRQLDPNSIRIHALTDQEQRKLEGFHYLREFQGWQLFCTYARRLQADHALLMYSDHFQLPMLLGRRAPCPFSCMYFRPTFHYSELANYHPTLRQRLSAYRKKALLKRVLRMDQLRVLYCLDAIAIDYIQRELPTHARVQLMPDSFVHHETPPERISELREELGIGEGRRVLLLLGVLDHRKGPQQLLEAVQRLPADALSNLCLLLVGRVKESLSHDVIARVKELQDTTNAQVILKNEYVSDIFVQDYYELADVALATYQRHMGMSSALIRAALAGVPVLASNYGLMGELVRRHRLGIIVDTSAPHDFTQALQKVIAATEPLFDADQALAFANQHSPDALAQALECGLCETHS